MRSAHLLATALCGVLLAPAAFAEGLQPLDRYWFGIGAYQSDNGLDIRVDGQDHITGTSVSFQDDLGFDSHETSLVYDLGATLADRHQFSITGHRYHGSASMVLERDLDINDHIYEVDAQFHGTKDIDVVSAAYTWFFHRNERSALGVGLGATYYSIDLGLSAKTAVANGAGGQAGATVEDDWNEAAWLPMIRLQYSRVLNDQWRFNVELAGVKKSEGRGRVSGKARDASVSLDYFPWERVGFTLKYNYDDIDLLYNHARYRGTMRLINQGPQLLATVKF